MKSLGRENVFYAFSPELEPKLYVGQGEVFALHTLDCYSGRVTSEDDVVEYLGWDETNPATGPVYVEGAKAGDLIRIEIRKIELEGPGVMTAIPGSGWIGAIKEPKTSVMESREGLLDVSVGKGGIRIPIRPMIGVLGVAPKDGRVINGEPGDHGGNMDCRLIGEGTVLCLSANVDGALFGLGDIHSLMGDGEVMGCGAETPAKVELSITVDNSRKLITPFLETPDLACAIATAAGLEEACRKAIDHMTAYLTEEIGLSAHDAGKLMSLAGDLAICQVVDPKYTARFEFPAGILNEIRSGI